MWKSLIKDDKFKFISQTNNQYYKAGVLIGGTHTSNYAIISFFLTSLVTKLVF